MSALTLDTDHVPGEEELNELYESVLKGFSPISSEPPYSPIPSSGMESHRSSTAIEPFMQRPGSSRSARFPVDVHADRKAVAWSINSQQAVLQAPQLPPQQATPGPSTTTHRRPLPPTPGPPNGVPAPPTPPTLPTAPEIQRSSSRPEPPTP